MQGETSSTDEYPRVSVIIYYASLIAQVHAGSIGRRGRGLL